MTIPRTQLEAAITDLDSRLDLFDPTVLSTILTVLQERLATIEASDGPHAQRKQVTILFANVSGLTQVAESIQDTNLLDVVNVLWQQLDDAIKTHGGTVDKHLGDGVMGVFGMHVTHEDDPARAVRAALAIRVALSNFLQDFRQMPLAAVSVGGRDVWIERLRDLRIRIGVNTGPVMLGHVGALEEFTVIGDAVNVSRRLEQAAPSGGILIAQDTYTHVRGQFNLEAVGPLTVKGRTDPVNAYLVVGARPRPLRLTSRGIEGIETRMIGRDEELRRVQTLLQRVVQARQGQMLTISGEAGVGKSRLIYELNRWVQAESAPDVVVLEARSEPEEQPLPYTLIRDLFTTYFDIWDSDRAAVAEEKLVQGVRQFLTQAEDEVRRRAQVIAQFVGLGGADRPVTALTNTEPVQLRDRAYRYVSGLFAAIAAVSKVTLLILEDIHWSDPESLALIKHASRVCRREPLLIISLTRPALFETVPTWLDEAGNVSHAHLMLPPLPHGDSHQLVNHILRKLPEIPPNLANLIVRRGEGNPFYVEEMIKVLIEDGVIIPDLQQWRLQSSQLTHVRVPSTLTGILQARLDRLSTLERTMLQKASVVGRIFWDRSVSQMRDETGRVLEEREALIALQALQKRELIFRRRSSSFAGAQEFVFKHAILRDVTYESVLLRQRPRYHRQAAEWLVTASGERVSEYASAIATHYEQANEKMLASQYYEIAAEQALKRYNPELAIRYSRKQLALLAEYPDLTVELLHVHRRLARLYRQQLQLVQAAQVYNMMQHAAGLAGDLEAQAQAFSGLAEVQRCQANYAGMLQQAERAEQAARLVHADLELIRAYQYQARAQQALGNFAEAQAAAAEALSLSERKKTPLERTRSLRLLCEVYLRSGEGARALPHLNRIAVLGRELNPETAALELAFNQVQRGSLYVDLGQYNKAAQLLMAALQVYRDENDQPAVCRSLALLGKAALLQGKGMTAATLFAKAQQLAGDLGDRQGELQYQIALSQTRLALKQFDEAIAILRQVIDVLQNEMRLINWLELGAAYAALAEAYQGLGNVAAAEAAVFRARQLAEKGHDTKALGASWRVMGLLAAAAGTPLVVEGATYDASACFSRGLRFVRGPGDRTTWREQAHLLWQWARHEEAIERYEKARQLRRRAERLVEKLDVTVQRLDRAE